MQLTGIKLNGKNFQQWSRSVKIALRTRTKLALIDGSYNKPPSTSLKYEQWIRCDSMFVSWLLNSIVLELYEAFLYTSSAEELWTELSERFGQSNGPLLYQVQKDISEIYQGNDSIAIYYTKLKRLWDELDDLSEVPVCDCTHKADCIAIKKTRELDQRQRLMQFLMKLNDGYESIRGQILLMDPLPSVSKAYSMIARVETQRNVTGNQSGGIKETAALSNRSSSINIGDGEIHSNALAVKGGLNQRPRKDNKKLKNNRYCDHCQKSGHTQDQCFKIIGYPDWYDGPRPDNSRTEGSRDAVRGRKNFKMAANAVSQVDHLQDSPLDEDNTTKNLR